MIRKPIEIGDKYSMLTVIDRAGVTKAGAQRFLMRCDCGTEKVITGCNFRYANNTKSCGCLPPTIKHGDSPAGKRSAEYNSWLGMIQRCEYEKYVGYASYGGRGIKICRRWRESYANFLMDMGRKPSSQHSIDRINNDGDYEPSNCRWATRAEQSANKRSPRKRTRQDGSISNPFNN